jgi:hypothetical protein
VSDRKFGHLKILVVIIHFIFTILSKHAFKDSYLLIGGGPRNFEGGGTSKRWTHPRNSKEFQQFWISNSEFKTFNNIIVCKYRARKGEEVGL